MRYIIMLLMVVSTSCDASDLKYSVGNYSAKTCYKKCRTPKFIIEVHEYSEESGYTFTCKCYPLNRGKK